MWLTAAVECGGKYSLAQTAVSQTFQGQTFSPLPFTSMEQPWNPPLTSIQVRCNLALIQHLTQLD